MHTTSNIAMPIKYSMLTSQEVNLSCKYTLHIRQLDDINKTR